MSSRLPRVIDSSTGRELSNYNSAPYHVNTPQTIGRNNILTGWLTNWQNDLRNRDLASMAETMRLLVSISELRVQIEVLTKRENIQLRVNIAAQELENKLLELQTAAQIAKDEEDIAKSLRDKRKKLAKYEGDLVEKEIAEKERPPEVRIREVYTGFRKLLNDLDADDTLHPDDKPLMRAELEALREQQLAEIRGRANTKPRKSNSDKAEAIRRRTAQFESEKHSLMNSGTNREAQRAELRKIRTKYEEDCNRIMEE